MKAAFLTGNLIAAKGSARPSAAITQPLELISDNPGHDKALNIAAPAFVPPRPGRHSESPETAFPCGLNDRKCLSSSVELSDMGEKMKQDNHGRVRLSIRMTPEQHLKLKILSAHSRKSVQSLMIDALDKQVSDYAANNLKGQCACINN